MPVLYVKPIMERAKGSVLMYVLVKKWFHEKKKVNSELSKRVHVSIFISGPSV
jgi:hypothetical protein